MNVIAHGIDLTEVSRIAAMHSKHGARFLDRVFTETEQSYCVGRKRMYEHLAGRFAAKEAVLKVLGTGWRSGIAWTDVQVTNAPSGKPSVTLGGKCAEIAAELGLGEVLLSITHTEREAMASAIGLARRPAASDERGS